MLMVIFGAGASHGSAPGQLGDQQHNERFRPPVTAELFDPRYGEYADKYAASRPAISRLRRTLAEAPRRNIETEIGRLGEETAGNFEQARHMLGLRFYLNDLIESRTLEWRKRLHGFNYYVDLLQRLGIWRYETGEEVALVTFNYDELLDFALGDQIGGRLFLRFAEYVERDDWRLYKLHGSTSWCRVLQSKIGTLLDHPSVTDVIARGESLDFESGELRPRPWKSGLTPSEEPSETLAAPGIAIPTDRKQTFSCPDEHVERFAEDAAKTTRVLVIGWRGSEPHALEILREQMPSVRQLAVADVTVENSANVINTLQSAGVETNFRAPLEGGFAGLLRTDGGWVLERWLES